MQVSHQVDAVAAPVAPFAPDRSASMDGPLSPAAMARMLRETNPLGARCFALEMHERVAWANESWGEFWAEVARLA